MDGSTVQYCTVQCCAAEYSRVHCSVYLLLVAVGLMATHCHTPRLLTKVLWAHWTLLCSTVFTAFYWFANHCFTMVLQYTTLYNSVPYCTEMSCIFLLHSGLQPVQYCTVHCMVVCPVSSVHCTLYTVHCTLYTLHCTLYTVEFTAWQYVHCPVYTVHCSL